MRRLDPDVISDQLRDLGDDLFADCRTVGLALRLDDLRRNIARVLATQPPMGRQPSLAVPPCETSRQAREQGAGDGLRVRDLEASIAAHGGRFAEVHAG